MTDDAIVGSAITQIYRCVGCDSRFEATEDEEWLPVSCDDCGERYPWREIRNV